MDLTALVNALNTVIQQASDEKVAAQADIDSKNSQINDLETAILGDKGSQNEDDAIIAGAQKFLQQLQPYISTSPASVPPVMVSGTTNSTVAPSVKTPTD